ncbi:hypothetical protein [Spirosoma flavum]|uniref:Uncharacterized protein n=1 Tax=Spirosoma flavum TaxID=2048557 RepID=A0ABW6AQG4_9BACT
MKFFTLSFALLVCFYGPVRAQQQNANQQLVAMELSKQLNEPLF